jgi:hypothetical protein
LIQTDGGAIRFHKPLVYQTSGFQLSAISSPQKPGARAGLRNSDFGPWTAVDGRYILTGTNQIRFALGAYDHTKPLVIDPILTYSTYLSNSQYSS